MDDYDDTDWSLVDFGDKKNARDQQKQPSRAVLRQCPKCGRKLGRGGHFHVKACKGHDNALSA